jgi:hypothetical protein
VDIRTIFEASKQLSFEDENDKGEEIEIKENKKNIKNLIKSKLGKNNPNIIIDGNVNLGKILIIRIVFKRLGDLNARD